MLDEIIDKYEQFSDSVIAEIRYYCNFYQLEVIIGCMNKYNNYKFERIKLVFSDVLLFRFFEVQNISSTIINSALLKNENGIITFDFFPLIYSDTLKENENSDFIIKCKKVTCTIVE